MTQVRVQNNLGVLESSNIDTSQVTDVAVEALRELGLSAPTPELRRALHVALVHRSYLYEHRHLLPGITSGLLDTLQYLGKMYLQKQTTAMVFRQGTSHTSGSLSKEVSLISPAFQSWSIKQAWIAQSCAVGGSLKSGPLPRRTTAALCYQVVGVLCLAGEEAAAAGLVDRVFGDIDQGESIGDPKTELEQRLKGRTASYEYQREGPDHAPLYRATVTDDRGRRGVGQGASKKAAGRQAALDFLRRYMAEAFGTPRVAAPSSVPREIPRQRGHSLLVQRLQDMFSLTEAARPLLSQALIHSSWAYEHRDVMANCHQQDNQVLGLVGSKVLNYEHAVACARHALFDPPEELALLTVPNETHDSAFRYAELKPGLLLGAGQASVGISTEMGANTFQAVIGAIFVAKGFPASLHPGWPREWKPVWRMVAQELPREADPTTLLEQMTSAMKLEIDFAFRSSGPTHAEQRYATIVLNSVELGVETRAGGAWISGNNSRAKHQASQVVLNVLHRLAERQPAQALASEDSSASALGRFLLSHQAAALAVHRIPVRRWVDAQLFGMHLASSPTDLLEWAQGADELLTRVVDFWPNISHLESAFRAASEIAGGRSEGVEPELAAVLGILERLETPDELTDDELKRLVQLANLYRCLGSDDPGIELHELADDWSLLHRGRLAIQRPLPNVRLSGRDRAILDAAVSGVLTPNTHASVEVTSSVPLRLRFLADAPFDQESFVRTCALWSSVSRTTTLALTECGIDATILSAAAPDSAGPITRAALAAQQPAPRPYQAAVADLLHDLKNQLVAARLADSSPADTRTARLEQQLAASRHLDQAQALMARLRSTALLLEPADGENVDLGTFLRNYASGVLARLPSSISLSIPDASRSVSVALDKRALTAILDNLVGNAIEALGDGGSIALEWTADDDEAVVEITDDGPGLPPDVIAALETGERVRSTKPGGNGLGLLGVRTLLGRFGGELTALRARSGTGTAWLVTMPVARTMTVEEQ